MERAIEDVEERVLLEVIPTSENPKQMIVLLGSAVSVWIAVER